MHDDALAGKEPYRKTVDEILAELGTDARSGLSRSKAQERLGQYGKNELAAESPYPHGENFLASSRMCSSSCCSLRP